MRNLVVLYLLYCSVVLYVVFSEMHSSVDDKLFFTHGAVLNCMYDRVGEKCKIRQHTVPRTVRM